MWHVQVEYARYDTLIKKKQKKTLSEKNINESETKYVGWRSRFDPSRIFWTYHTSWVCGVPWRLSVKFVKGQECRQPTSLSEPPRKSPKHQKQTRRLDALFSPWCTYCRTHVAFISAISLFISITRLAPSFLMLSIFLRSCKAGGRSGNKQNTRQWRVCLQRSTGKYQYQYDQDRYFVLHTESAALILLCILQRTPNIRAESL